MSRLARSTALLLVTFPGLAQEDPKPAPPPPSADALMQRFERLDRDQRNTVVRNMERRMRRNRDPWLQRIAGFERGLTSYPKKARRGWYLPRDYAPKAAARRLISVGSSAHKRATRQMTEFEFLPDMHSLVTFDWVQGKASRIADGLSDNRRFENYVRGYAPGADHAIASILETLDAEPEQRALSFYFEHLYADRNGGVYAGVSMFDAWNSGVTVEMPDTDAIAYARDILHTQSFQSPIPADRRRERLYKRVREGFAAHRASRTLRMVAAATFVATKPRIDPTYEPLIRRCRWLWMQCDYDVEQFRTRLAQSGDRATFLAEIDRAIESSLEVVEAETQAFLDREHYMRALAQRELEAAQQ